MMLELKDRFNEAGVPFAAMDLTVQPPRAEDGQRPDGEIRVEGFPCDAIVPDGLVDRIREADQELEEYYAQEDAERKRQEAALVPIDPGAQEDKKLVKTVLQRFSPAFLQDSGFLILEQRFGPVSQQTTLRPPHPGGTSPGGPGPP